MIAIPTIRQHVPKSNGRVKNGIKYVPIRVDAQPRTGSIEMIALFNDRVSPFSMANLKHIKPKKPNKKKTIANRAHMWIYSKLFLKKQISMANRKMGAIEDSVMANRGSGPNKCCLLSLMLRAVWY